MTRYNPTTMPGPGDRVTWPYDPADDAEIEWDAMVRAQKRESLEQLSKEELIEMFLDLEEAGQKLRDAAYVGHVGIELMRDKIRKLEGKQ